MNKLFGKNGTIADLCSLSFVLPVRLRLYFFDVMLRKTISLQTLREQLGDKNILQFYFGAFDVGKNYRSFFREDEHASTSFFYSEKSGSLVYRDFATGEVLDFVGFVKKLFKCSYLEALQRIAIDFGLIPGERSSTRAAIIERIEPKPKKDKVLKVGVCKFTAEHLAYWAKYGITLDELIANNVYAVQNMFINGIVIPTKVGALRFAYLLKDEDDKEYLKVYSPNDTEYKWVSSSPLSLPFGLHELQFTGDTLVITKSAKERLIAKKFYPEVIGFQNESRGAIEKEVFNVLRKKYPNIIYFGDNDKTGLEFCKWMRTKFVRVIHFPQECLTKYGVKDIADFVALYGLRKFEIWLRLNNLL